jgi:hypothetical protein
MWTCIVAPKSAEPGSDETNEIGVRADGKFGLCVSPRNAASTVPTHAERCLKVAIGALPAGVGSLLGRFLAPAALVGKAGAAQSRRGADRPHAR